MVPIKEIASQLDALIKLRNKFQKICDELDNAFDKTGDPMTGRKLNAVQSCIDCLKEAEKELSDI